MATSVSPRRLTARRVRGLQRGAHLVAAFLLVAYVYGAPPPGSTIAVATQYVFMPALLASGLALWKWRRIRSLLRRQG